METDQTAIADNHEKYELDEQAGFILRLAYQRHLAIFSENMGGDLTSTQFSTLFRLAEVPGAISQNALGRLVGMDAATTKGVISRLLARDLVRMERDKKDRRRYMLSTTEKGRTLIADVLPKVRRISDQTLAPLSPNERHSLLRLLKKIC